MPGWPLASSKSATRTSLFLIPYSFLNAGLAYNAGMIAKELLEILVCPACKQALEYRQNPESLKCPQCHRVYAVKDDIPIMLVDEAKIET
jgi:uncharacterized protein